MTPWKTPFFYSFVACLVSGGPTFGYEVSRSSIAHDIGTHQASDHPFLPPVDPLSFNAAVPGSKRGLRDYFPAHALDKRQGNGTCTQPGYVLVCPITEATPCCAPGYPICCHEPSDTCCPQGSFCQGLHSCCLEGSTGCGEGCCVAGVPCCNNSCCPSSAYVCDASSGTPTCVSNSTTPASSSSSSHSSSITFAAPTITETPQSSKNNTPLIAGATAGGVVALIIIALAAYCALKKRRVTPLAMEPKETRVDLAPTPAPYITPNEDRARYSMMSAVPFAHAPSLMGTQPTQSTAGSVLGEPTQGASSAYTGIGYTPPPPEMATAATRTGLGANYYANTPIYDLGGVSTPSQTASSPNSPHGIPHRVNSLSPHAGIAATIPPWLNGSVMSHGSIDNTATSFSPSPHPEAANISPIGSPPPPAFSPPPQELGGAGVGYAPWAYPPEETSTGAGRVVPTDAPRDVKARPSGRA